MSTTAQAVPTGTYKLDPLHSTITFGVGHLGLSSYRTGFDAFDAQLSDGVLSGTAEVASIQIGMEAFKGHIVSADFLDAESAPTLTFQSTAIRPGADGSVEVEGDLTIRGVTKPVTAKGTIATGQDGQGNERVGFGLETVVDRRDFGIAFDMQTPTGNDVVGWDITITVEIELVKA